MQYENIKQGVFLSRPNRFIAHIEIDGVPEICHVKNTGRCKELLVPGATVYVQAFDTTTRKTKFDLIAVEKGARLINMDAQAPNRVFREWVESGGFLPGITLLRPEQRFGDSRLDFYLEIGSDRLFVEVKGVTLEADDVVLFPDAPTPRGVRHVQELIACQRMGYRGYLVFIVQMQGVRYFTPNKQGHPQFAVALAEAKAAGVQLLALDCQVTKDSLTIRSPVEILL